MVEMFNPTEKLELLAASASEIHAAASEHGKLRVEFKSDEDRTRKRQLRLLKNRQSAALSRQRKKEYITDLEERTNGLITENHDLVQKIAKLSSINVEFKMHIDSLEKSLNETKNENNELRSRLASINNNNNNNNNGISSPLPSSPSFTNNNTNNNMNTNNTNNTTTTSSLMSPLTNTLSTTTITTTSTISISSLSSPSLSLSSSSSIVSEENSSTNSPIPVQKNPSVSP